MTRRRQTKLELKRRRHRAASARYYQKKADELRALGLCIYHKRRGQPRKYAAHYFESHWTERRNEIMQMKRAAFVEQGLTTKGTARKCQLRQLPRAVNWKNISTDADRKAYNANAAARARIYRQHNLSLGLTAKGKPRKDGLAPRTAHELAWREFRSTLRIPEERNWTNLVNFGERSEAA